MTLSKVMWVDSRVGSKELLNDLQARGVPAKLAALDAGDFVFTGHGPDGDAEVAVERKALSDLTGSLRSGRLQGLSTEESASQLDRLHASFEFVWLLVEGLYTTDSKGKFVKLERHGNLRQIPGGFSEDSLEKSLLSLDLRGGLRIKQTANQSQSVRWLATLFRSFTDKEWDQHTTLKTMIRPERMTGPHPVSPFRLAVMDLCPGIGLSASLAVERFVKPIRTDDPRDVTLTVMVERLLQMTLANWETLEVLTPAGPRKLGTAKALKVLEALRKR
jgi:ERCC4-type nuclease